MARKKPADHAEPAPPASGAPVAPNRRPGSQPGNQNRTTHGRYRATKGTIRRTPLHRDEYDAPARVKAREVYRGLGREWAPERETYRELYGAKLRGRARLDLRGWYDSRGEAKQAATQWYELVERLEAMERRAREAKAELDGGPAESEAGARAAIAALAARWPGALEYRIVLHDGTPFSMGGVNAGAPLAFDPMAGSPAALPAHDDAPRPNVAVAGTLLDAHPLDLDSPKPALVETTPKTIDVETPLQRNWRLGLAADGSDYD